MKTSYAIKLLKDMIKETPAFALICCNVGITDIIILLERVVGWLSGLLKCDKRADRKCQPVVVKVHISVPQRRNQSRPALFFAFSKSTERPGFGLYSRHKAR
jgi:hypothetical protein